MSSVPTRAPGARSGRSLMLLFRLLSLPVVMLNGTPGSDNTRNNNINDRPDLAPGARVGTDDIFQTAETRTARRHEDLGRSGWHAADPGDDRRRRHHRAVAGD